MSADKINFLRSELIMLLEKLSSDDVGSWGKMNAQQMVEHLADFFDISAGKIKTKLYTPEEHLPKYLDFLRSDKEFRENTKAPVELIPEEPLPVKLPSMEAALERLKNSVQDFIDHFSNNPESKTLHPAFGWLNFDDWTILHYKHVNHHLKQFTS